ncbi:hypothetical protein [Solimonas marina]|uniref:Uncharacterized protein n=1 Tax=Solimonas marina TaxID=2714601 RepID=A0A970B9I3_9GAMM|nr:hypothetical protein [Solimonas marina]NKF22416.1 hypothetical protein [Solimonas marina]
MRPLLSSPEAPHEDVQSPLAFFTYASITPDQRESLLQHLQREPDGEDKAVKLALLQSLPGSSAYNPVTARQRLSAISYSRNAEYAALARLRLHEMSDAGLPPPRAPVAPPTNTTHDSAALAACNVQVKTLQDRLDKIVDIERSLDNNGNGTQPDSAR